VSYSHQVANRHVVVLGGRPRAAATVAELLAEGARVTVVAESPDATLEDLIRRGLVEHRSSPDLDLIEGADLVIRPAEPDPTPPASSGVIGSVTLVGGGPGDPGLISLAGREAIEAADVIVTDRLAPPAALNWARDDAEVIDVAKIPRGRSTPQERINRLLTDAARSGRRAVRLKGGDSFVFGRGGEELVACAEAGVPTRVIPGVSSALAAPSAAGIPLTHRGLTQGFVIVSGHVAPDDPACTVNWDAVAVSGLTVVVLMGVRQLAAITARLVAAGMAEDTPAAIVADGTLASQRTVRATVADLAERAAAEGIGPPAVTVIGDVAGLDLNP